MLPLLALPDSDGARSPSVAHLCLTTYPFRGQSRKIYVHACKVCRVVAYPEATEIQKLCIARAGRRCLCLDARPSGGNTVGVVRPGPTSSFPHLTRLEARISHPAH